MLKHKPFETDGKIQNSYKILHFLTSKVHLKITYYYTKRNPLQLTVDIMTPFHICLFYFVNILVVFKIQYAASMTSAKKKDFHDLFVNRMKYPKS